MPKVERKRPARCSTVTDALPSPLEIDRKLIAFVTLTPTEEPILVMSCAELRSLVMRTSSVGPGGKLPCQSPLVFQSNVPPAVFDQRDSADALWADVTMKRADATTTVSLTRIAILPFTTSLDQFPNSLNTETYYFSTCVYTVKRFIKSTQFFIHFRPFLIHLLWYC